MTILPEPHVLLPLLAIAALAGATRGFTGFGSALVFMPFASTIVPPWQAVIILYVIDTVSTLPLVPKAMRQCDRAEVAPLSMGAAVMVPVGAYFLTTVDPTALRWILSGLALGAVALLASGWRYQARPSRTVSVLVGACSGFLGGMCSFWGPPIALFWLGGQSRVETIRANIIMFLAIASVVAGITYAIQGLFRADVVLLALLLMPAYGAMVWVGSRMFPYASDRVFRRIAYTIITGSAITGLPAFDREA